MKLIPLPLPLQMFLVPTIHGCSCYIHLCTLFPLTIEHEGQPNPKLGEAFGVRVRQRLSPGHHSEIGVSQFCANWCFKVWLASSMNSGFVATIFLARTCSLSAKASSISWIF